MKWRIGKDKQAVMGVGMLLLFVSTILVSAIAAGVLIRATGLMEESAIGVAEDTRDRLVSGVDIFAVYAYGNTTTETIDALEYYVRLRSGSPALQLENMGYSYVEGGTTYEANLNESLVGDSCQFDNITTDTFCLRILNGNEDTILETGELVAIRTTLGNGTGRLNPQDEFEANFQVQATGTLNTFTTTVPDLILDEKIRLR